MILSYRNEIIFTDCSIREYWDEQNTLMVDRDINAAVNLKRLGLGIFPSIKRRSGNLDIVGTMDDNTTKEILHTLNRAVGSLHLPLAVSVGVCHEVPKLKQANRLISHRL